MTRKELRKQFFVDCFDIPDNFPTDYEKWLEDKIIKYEKGLDLIMSDDSDRVREFVND